MNEDLSQSMDLYRQARQMMDNGELDDAVVLFYRSIELSPHFKALELLGECLMRFDRLREAIAPLAAATSLHRGVRAPSLLADVFLKLKDYQAAEKMADIALSRDSNNRKAIEVKKVVARSKGAA